MDGEAERGGRIRRLRELLHHPSGHREEDEPQARKEVGRQRPEEPRLAEPPEVGLVAPHREADHRGHGDPEWEAAAGRRPAELPVGVDHGLDHHVDAPEDQDRGDQVAGEDADAREAEQVVEDHQPGEEQRQREDVPPTVEAVPERDHQVRLERDPAERRDQDERRDDPRADEPEDRPRQERVRLAGARAEVRAEHRVDDVERVAKGRDADRCGEAVAAVVQFEAEEHVREAGDERRPETHEMPHGPPPVERDDAGIAGRIVVLDRLVERLALEREIVA